MSLVTGNVRTKYGTMQFFMGNPDEAVLTINRYWTVHGVDYQGKTQAARLKETQDAVSLCAVDGWYEQGEFTYIRREMLKIFALYINHPQNVGVLVWAKKCQLDSERATLTAKVSEAERNLKSASAALEQWNRDRGQLHRVITKAVEAARVNVDVHIEG